MPYNNMTGSLSDTLGGLKQLTLLQLYNNRIQGSIPHTLGDLQLLMGLHLSFNQVEGSIPQTLGGLKQLTYLVLWNNRLTGVVPSLPFEQYTGECKLQAPASPSNRYTCPLPAVSPLVCTVQPPPPAAHAVYI
jgi:hypothetical protein